MTESVLRHRLNQSTPFKPMIDPDLFARYEEGELSQEEFLDLFQQIFDTGAHRWLEGHYGRTLSTLCRYGVIDLK